MSNDAAGYVSASLGQFLVAVADGLAHAQQTLTNVRTLDENGRPGPTYHIPRLDFEVRVAASMTSTESWSGPVSRTPTKGDRALMVDVATAQQASTSSFSAEALSTIRGSVVAVPPNAGSAAPRITTTVEATSVATVFRVRVEVRDAANSSIQGVEVHFNPEDPAIPLQIALGLVRTDAAGLAVTDVTVPTGQKRGLVIDVADLTEVVLVGAN